MNVLQQVTCVGLCLGLAVAVPTATQAQQNSSPQDIGNPLTGPSVRSAPFSAEATTTVQQTLRDGTRIDRTSSARYYRDSAGRVRVEQPIIGVESLNAAAEKHVRITIDTTPGDGGVYILDPLTRTAGQASRGIASLAVGGGNTFALPLGGPQFLIFSRPGSARDHLVRRGAVDVKEESLGGRRIAGVDTIGRRGTVTIPIGQVGNDRPIEIVDERWESPELEIVIYSHSSDSRSGVIEYRLANIQRTEPDPSLFVIPEDYTPGFSTNTELISLWYADNVTPTAGDRWQEIVRRQGFLKLRGDTVRR